MLSWLLAFAGSFSQLLASTVFFWIQIFGTNIDPCRKGASYTSKRFRQSLQMRDHPKTSSCDSCSLFPLLSNCVEISSQCTVHKAATFQIASMSSLLPRAWAISILPESTKDVCHTSCWNSLSNTPNSRPALCPNESFNCHKHLPSHPPLVCSSAITFRIQNNVGLVDKYSPRPCTVLVVAVHMCKHKLLHPCILTKNPGTQSVQKRLF